MLPLREREGEAVKDGECVGEREPVVLLLALRVREGEEEKEGLALGVGLPLGSRVARGEEVGDSVALVLALAPAEALARVALTSTVALTLCVVLGEGAPEALTLVQRLALLLGCEADARTVPERDAVAQAETEGERELVGLTEGLAELLRQRLAVAVSVGTLALALVLEQAEAEEVTQGVEERLAQWVLVGEGERVALPEAQSDGEGESELVRLPEGEAVLLRHRLAEAVRVGALALALALGQALSEAVWQALEVRDAQVVALALAQGLGLRLALAQRLALGLCESDTVAQLEPVGESELVRLPEGEAVLLRHRLAEAVRVGALALLLLLGLALSEPVAQVLGLCDAQVVELALALELGLGLAIASRLALGLRDSDTVAQPEPVAESVPVSLAVGQPEPVGVSELVWLTVGQVVLLRHRVEEGVRVGAEALALTLEQALRERPALTLAQ